MYNSCWLDLSTGLSTGKTYGRKILTKKEDLAASSFAEAMEDGRAQRPQR
jgi:hypothetical protein